MGQRDPGDRLGRGGPGVRLDTHVYQGYRVPPFYDSLLAKLIVSGNTREEAIDRARNALSHMVVEGVHTTVDFLLEVTQDEEFRSGDIDTGFLARYFARRPGGGKA